MKNQRRWRQLLAAVLAAALLTGCGSSKNAETEEVQIQQESGWESKYGIPEEMRFVETLVEQDGEEAMAGVLKLVRHDFGIMEFTCEFDGGVRIEYYSDGYKKVYLEQEATEKIPVDNEQEYLLRFFDADGEVFSELSYAGSPMRGNVNAQDVYTRIMTNQDGRAVYYLIHSYLREREPVRMDVVLENDPEGEPVLSLTRDATGLPLEVTIKAEEETVEKVVEEPTEEATEAPTEETKPAGPALTTKVLDLAGCTLQDVSAALGEYTEAFGFYWFDGGEVGYVYAYGTDRGNNYIQAPLDRLITGCPASLSLEQLQEYLPGGCRTYDEMDGVYCYCWNYRGIDAVVFENADGTYTPDSLFYYNCDVLAQQSPQAPKVEASVNQDIFQILGKTESQIAEILGSENGGYDYEYGCWVYPYQDTYVSVYLGDDGTCIGFNSTIQNVMKMSGSVDTAELKKLFGSTYDDPWNGETAYHTMYKGGRLCIYQGYDDEIGHFGSQSVVNFFQGDAVAFPDVEQTWTNSDSLFYGGLTVHALSASQLICSLEYYQLTPPNRSAMTDRITLTSTDGITYTASGVVDTWESQMNVTVTMLEGAAQVSFEYTKMGDLANFCFGDFIVYQ